MTSDSLRTEIEGRAVAELSRVTGLVVGPAARTSTMTTIPFSAGGAFVELELDWREAAAFLLVGLLTESGARPGGYYVDPHGRRVRWHLGSVLKTAGRSHEAARLVEVVGASSPGAMLRQVQTYSQVLADCVDDLPELIAVSERTSDT